MLSTLDKKLLRDLWRIKGQALAVILVIAAGIALQVMSHGMMRSLEETMRAYYERYRFADIYAPVKRAPAHVVSEIQALDGVSDAIGRITGGGLIELPEAETPVSAKIVSFDPDTFSPINGIYLAEGRMIDPTRRNEILLLRPFAEAHGLSPGDEISITVYGARYRFKISGLALSPEFVYAIPPGAFVSDPASYAIVWASNEAIEAAFDLDGAFNEFLLATARGANSQALIDELDRLLAPYGAIGAFSRADQTSNRYLVEELAQLNTMGRVMTPIFLGVAVFLMNIVITRLVETERDQIGIMKAFGYANHEVGAHYLKFVIVIALAGAVVGWGGGLWLGKLIAGIYQTYFHFPFLVFVAEFGTFAIALAVSGAAAALGAIAAVRSAIALSPAVAMRPPAPPKFARGRGFSGRIFNSVDQLSRMIFRRLAHQPFRAALTTFGIGAAMSLSVMMRFNVNATDYMLDVSFNIVDRSDIFVSFIEPLSQEAVFELGHIEGVTLVEPVRSSPVLFLNKRITQLGAITALSEQPVLNRVVDENLLPVTIRGEGIVLSRQLADLLAAPVGEMIRVELRDGRRPVLDVPVVGVVEALVGTPAYMPIDALNRRLKEPLRISGAYLKADPLKRASVYRELKSFPEIAGVSLQREAYKNFEKVIDEGPGTFRYIMTVFSIVIAVGVVYNSARIGFIERSHDLASLRVMGFTKTEAGYVLLGEIIALVIFALPIGSVLGFLIWSYLAGALSTELYQIPVIYREDGLGYAAMIVLLAATAASAYIQRDINRLDLVSALKTKE